MHQLAVLAERFAVIGGEDEQRVVADAEARQRPVEASDQLVGPGDFAVVRALGVSRGIGFGWFVRRVRIVEMHPRKRPLAPVAFEPCRRVGDRDVAAFFQDVEEARLVRRVGAEIETIGELVEPARQTGLRRQHDRRHESGGIESGGLERLRHRRHIRGQRARDVVADAVLRRIEAGEDRDVRRPRDRCVHRRVERQRAFARDPIEVRRRDIAAAVAPEPIGAQCVDGDDENVTRRACDGVRSVVIAAEDTERAEHTKKGKPQRHGDTEKIRRRDRKARRE